MSGGSPIMDAYVTWEQQARAHRAGAFPTDVLRGIERLLPRSVSASAETGCGKSTILLSNISSDHTVFCLDDSEFDDSSVRFYSECPLTRLDRLRTVFGPTQRTLPVYQHPHQYDVVLIDGPHGWPYPELEYYAFYPHIAIGGLLIVDDCNIPTIGRMADVLAEDDMWSLERFVSTTAIFRRTEAKLFDPFGDGWWEQRYNRRRVSPKAEAHLSEDTPVDTVSRLRLDARLHGDPLPPRQVEETAIPGIPSAVTLDAPPPPPPPSTSAVVVADVMRRWRRGQDDQA